MGMFSHIFLLTSQNITDFVDFELRHQNKTRFSVTIMCIPVTNTRFKN